MTYPGAVEVSTGTFVEHTVIGYTEHVDPFKIRLKNNTKQFTTVYLFNVIDTRWHMKVLDSRPLKHKFFRFT